MAFFDSPDFRAMLQECCPTLAALPAEAVLQRYRLEAQTAELAHALPARSGGGPMVDVTLEELGKMSFFPNEFQVALMKGLNTTSAGSHMSDTAMQEIFGCKPFAAQVPTWSEASSRLIYVAHNMRRLDTGSIPHFGDFTVIFNSSRMKESVIIAAYDTGMYEMTRLHPASRGNPALNCSAWSKDGKAVVPPGTLDYLDHLILPNLWSAVNTTVSGFNVFDVARGLFTRSALSGIDYGDVPAIDNSIRNDYFESDILANPPLPEAVKFAIAGFATLFGTEEGRDMQSIALRNNWPLFWAYGEGVQRRPPLARTPGETHKLNRRFADPANLAQTTNASVSNEIRNFEQVWQEAAELRARREITNEDLLTWWAALEQVNVAPVSATSCAAPQHCVAVNLANKDCICVLKQDVVLA